MREAIVILAGPRGTGRQPKFGNTRNTHGLGRWPGPRYPCTREISCRGARTVASRTRPGGPEVRCGRWEAMPETSRYDQATSTVRVIHFSSQNCIQADIQSPRPLPHMNLNVSERLIWALRGLSEKLSRLTDRVTGQKKKTVRERRGSEHGDDGGG